MLKTSLVWFRNDLRIDDNPALFQALRANTTLALFFLTESQWQRFHMAPIKVDFIKRHIALLQAQLAKINVKLHVLKADDFAKQQTLIRDFVHQHEVEQVYANQELELDERQRDESLINAGLPLQLFEADVIVNKGTVLNKEGSMYRVFSAFKRAWLTQVKLSGFSYCDIDSAGLCSERQQQWQSAMAIDTPEQADTSLSAKWPLSIDVQRHTLPNFYQNKLAQYAVNRDIPGVKGTSGISPYLAIGAISVRTILRQLLQRHPDLLDQPDSPEFSWLNELIWRDFYRHLLHHYPELIKGRSFNRKYDQLQWPMTSDVFQLWCEGKTGFPIIDAAMRQLKQTGWMHNRLRMIVASFLTKNLLVNWRLGERFFMQHLIDGDFAANNGGWQWSAGTGCDAQPYFRVFNPQSQSKKFDPSGTFIRKYLPELNEVPDKYIHAPYSYLIEQGQAERYWPEIVDLKQSRLEAIAFYGMKSSL